MISEQQRDSLVRRVRAMQELSRRGTADLTTEQMNHVERPGVLPIAHTLLHCVPSADRQVARLFEAGDAVWERWSGRVLAAGPLPVSGTPMAEAEKVRVTSAESWRAYQDVARERIAALVEGATGEQLDAPVERLGRPYHPPAGTLALVVPEGPIRLIDALETFVYLHGIRHLGELDLARALVGLGGVS